MVDYRMYCLDGDGGIGFAQWFEAESDEEAVRHARMLKPDVLCCEVWQRGRLVATIDANLGVIPGPRRRPGDALEVPEAG